MIKKAIATIFNTKVDAVGLSVFRMAYSLILFFEVLHLFKFRNIIYDKIPFDYAGEINFLFIFGFWVVTLLFLFLGLFTRTATIINYIFGVIIFSSAIHFEYHVFYTYLGINFLMLFMPISRVLSLDSLIQKVKYNHIGKIYNIDRKVLEINYLVPVYVGIALIYFDSFFLKMGSYMWTSGLGVWMPSSVPLAVWNDTSFLLNQKELIIFLGYFVLLFELLFIFLFWFRKLRVPLALIGICFHIGIFICYPIPLFALTFIILYLLLIPPTFWLRLSNYWTSKKIYYTFYYDAECPLCNKVVVVIKYLDIFKTVSCKTVQGNYLENNALKSYDEDALLINIHGVTNKEIVYVGYSAYIQLFKSMRYLYPIGILFSVPGISYIGKQVYRYIAGERLTIRCTSENCTLPQYNEPISEGQDVVVKGWNRLAVTKKFWKIIIVTLFILQCLIITKVIPTTLEIAVKKFVGVAKHGVFLDSHFKGYNHIFKVVYISENGVESIVPIMDSNGMPGDYVSGVTWRNISFDVVSPTIEKNNFESGILPYLKFYLKDTNRSEAEANFEFYFKEIKSPKVWERDFLKHQMNSPWIKAGTGQIGKNIEFKWNDAMDRLVEKESK